MLNNLVDNKKKYLDIGKQNENLLQNKTVQSFNNTDELKKFFLDENNQIFNNHYNKSMIYINQNMNNISSNSYNYEENIKGILEENSNLFLEINQLNKEKYKIKLNHLLNVNKELKEKNQKVLKHNEQMKMLYKKYSGKNWKKE